MHLLEERIETATARLYPQPLSASSVEKHSAEAQS
jgi:hypothetical protein